MFRTRVATLRVVRERGWLSGISLCGGAVNLPDEQPRTRACLTKEDDMSSHIRWYVTGDGIWMTPEDWRAALAWREQKDGRTYSDRTIPPVLKITEVIYGEPLPEASIEDYDDERPTLYGTWDHCGHREANYLGNVDEVHLWQCLRCEGSRLN